MHELISAMTIPAADECRTVSSLTELGTQKFGCIYADPPWRYRNRASRGAAENHYSTLSVDELCSWPVASVVAEDAHLHLWTTVAFLPDAFRVMEAWGFKYRGMFVWVKPQMGLGNYWRVSHEFMLLGVRGEEKPFCRALPSCAKFPRRKHSEKPEEVRQMIESVSPAPFLELFGRKRTPRWTVLGNQIED